MIKQFLDWLISHYYTPAQAAEPQSTGDTMSEPLVDTSAQAQPAAVEVQSVSPVVPATAADATLQPVAPVEASALDKAKADFDKFVAFVEHGIEVLGKEAEETLVALKDKFL